jgi:hypothetical protein
MALGAALDHMGASGQKRGGLIEMSSRHGDNHAVDDAGGK